MNTEVEYMRLQADIILLQREMDKIKEDLRVTTVNLNACKPIVLKYYSNLELDHNRTLEVLYG